MAAGLRRSDRLVGKASRGPIRYELKDERRELN